MARIIQVALLIGFIVGAESSATACPFCESSTAAKVRAGIFDSDFVYHLGVSLAPFPILMAIVILIYCWPARYRRLPDLNRVPSEEPLETVSEQI